MRPNTGFSKLGKDVSTRIFDASIIRHNGTGTVLDLNTCVTHSACRLLITSFNCFILLEHVFYLRGTQLDFCTRCIVILFITTSTIIRFALEHWSTAQITVRTHILLLNSLHQCRIGCQHIILHITIHGSPCSIPHFLHCCLTHNMLNTHRCHSTIHHFQSLHLLKGIYHWHSLPLKRLEALSCTFKVVIAPTTSGGTAEDALFKDAHGTVVDE
mmetsp:Transcript_21065/g.30852  ORF Transcript_21065/g.30852 Transcript_21065/m.30852 type:complete len:214 (+) Transcript_21065:232-873(+)